MSGNGFGAAVGQRFIETGDLTQSTIDLSLMPALNEKLDAVAQEIMSNPELDVYRMGVERSYSYDGPWGYDHDLRGFLRTISDRTQNSELVEKIDATIAVLDEAIVSNYTHEDLSHASGLSIYAPPADDWGLEPQYFDGSWSEDTLWDDMLQKIFQSR